MKKFMNAADTMVAESVEGFVRAHEEFVVFGAGRQFVRRRHLVPGKVAVISGGGAGHEPMHVGFVGRGMLDAACVGHIFTSPTPGQILSAIEDVDTGAGCLLVVKNYDGDLMNFEMAAEMASSRHRIEMVIVSDDIETASTNDGRGRRGIAGTVIMERLLGAAAENGMVLAELKPLAAGLASRVRSMGVALTGVTVPHTRRSTFSLGPEEIEMGVGIHGEPGRSREPFSNADTIVRHLSEVVFNEVARVSDKALLFVNGLGGTPPAELYLAYNVAHRFMQGHGLQIARSLVGTYASSLDMQGLSISLALLRDEEFALWDSPVATAALRWGC